MEDKDDIYRNLVEFLKLFKNRPYHLAKFLVEKKALNDKFKKDLLESNKLSNIDEKNQRLNNFTSISEMEDYLQSIFEKEEYNKDNKEEMEVKLNKKLNELIKLEKYEDAACLRDYMVMQGFKRKLKF